jgi:hypothetical protein
MQSSTTQIIRVAIGLAVASLGIAMLSRKLTSESSASDATPGLERNLPDLTSESVAHEHGDKRTRPPRDELEHASHPAHAGEPIRDFAEQSESIEASNLRAASVGRVARDSLLPLVRDCPDRPGGCHSQAQFALKIVESEPQADGWSDWMEDQILHDLLLAASRNHFSEVASRCSTEGCVFYVAASISTALPDRGSDAWRNEFEGWLKQREWAAELAGSRDSEPLRSFSDNRIFGSSTRPYKIWYVVRRRS